MLGENHAHGKKVHRFDLAERHPDGTWAEVAGGESIGHKRIEGFAPHTFTASRMTILRAVAEPRFRLCAAVA